jgi:hypothetical protein
MKKTLKVPEKIREISEEVRNDWKEALEELRKDKGYKKSKWEK